MSRPTILAAVLTLAVGCLACYLLLRRLDQSNSSPSARSRSAAGAANDQPVVLPPARLPPTSKLGLSSPSDQRLGSVIGPVEVRDLAGRSVDFWADEPAEITVVAFLGTECPLVAKQVERLQALHEESQPNQLRVVGVFSNVQDSLDEVREFVREHRLTFSNYWDSQQDAVRRFGATRTPEVLVLNSRREVVYTGCIALQESALGEPGTATSPDAGGLAPAVDDLRAGRAVRIPSLSGRGCVIGRPSTPDGTARVTWAPRIAEIFQRRCQTCHRPGQIGPFPLLTYADTQGWAETIREVVVEQRMPPWGAEAEPGYFQDDPRLSADEISDIVAWADAGAPEGDPARTPPPRVFPEGWRLKNPDRVIAIQDEPYRVPATGAIDYQRFSVRLSDTEDLWVVAVEPRPDCRGVVHHMSILVKPPINLELALELGQVNEIGGYVPGTEFVLWTIEPDASGNLPDDAEGWAVIPRGYDVVIEMHYTPNGVEQTDRSQVALKFGRAPPASRRHAGRYNVLTPTAGVQPAPAMGLPFPAGSSYRTVYVSNWEFVVPPGVAAYPVDAWYTFPEDAVLHFLIPHMHWRGKSFHITATLPDGQQRQLLNVPRYDFNWQHVYRLATPLALPRGTRVHCRAEFDNSPANARNPAPSLAAIPGLQSWNEMDNGLLGFEVADLDPSGTRARDPQRAAQELLAGYTPPDGISPEKLPQYYFQRALCRRTWGDAAGAEADLNLAISQAPTNAEFRRQRATWRSEAGALGDALEDLNVVVANSPDDAEAWCARGYLLLAQGQFAGAVADLDRAVSLRCPSRKCDP